MSVMTRVADKAGALGSIVSAMGCGACFPALASLGIDLKHLIIIQAPNAADRLWAVEQTLKSASFGALLAWLPQAGDLDRSFRSGDIKKARAQMATLFQAMKELESGKFVQKVKYGCEVQGIPVGESRLPLGPLIVRFADRLGQLQGLHVLQQCRVVLLGAHQLGFAPGQRAQ